MISTECEVNFKNPVQTAAGALAKRNTKKGGGGVMFFP
jgi:hypothetical protein